MKPGDSKAWNLLLLRISNSHCGYVLSNILIISLTMVYYLF